MKNIFAPLPKILFLLLNLVLANQAYSQTNDCNNNAGGELTVGATCNATAMNSTNGTDYWNSATGCGAQDRDDVWAWFTATSTSTTITYQPVANRDAILTLLTGACSPTMGSLDCSDVGANGVAETIVHATTIGQVYRIRVQRDGSNNNMNGTICVFNTPAPPTPPANDDPCNAILLTSGVTCTNTTGTNVDATDSGIADPGCASYSGGDVWYSVVVPAGGSITATTSTAGGFTDGGMATYSGTCGALTFLSCNDDGGAGLFSEITETGLTPGSTVWIRVWEFGNDVFGDFNICVTEPAPAITNDDPCGAIALPVGASCTPLTTSNIGATASAGVPAPGCASYTTADVWYTVTVPANGGFNVATFENGGFTDGGLATYSGTCGALTLETCDDDGGVGLFGDISETGLTPGQTIWIRVWDFDDGTGTFDICASEVNACGDKGPNVGTNDFCSTPATLTAGTGTFSATTAATFTQDTPGNVGTVFCGSIENNSWYQFTASSTAESFPVTVVSGCAAGIQAEIYEITYDGNGCCDAFTSRSNCYNPGNTTLGTVDAVGLTIGNQYMLMIDGNGGANCDFTISGWTGVNILPVEIIGFFGHTYENENLLTWTTASEVNNDYFIIEKSIDGINYKKVGTVNGSGNSSSKIDYEFSDENINSRSAYYRLTQVDFDGATKVIGNIILTRELNNVIAYPNPASENLTFSFNNTKPGNYTIEFIDAQGRIITENAIVDANNSIQSLTFPSLNNGLYFVRISDNGSNIIQTFKILKE